MPDISMCDHFHCTLKETCYRYKATPNPYGQSYSKFRQDNDGNCDYYWELKPESNENEKQTN